MKEAPPRANEEKALFLSCGIEKRLRPNLSFTREECGITDDRTSLLPNLSFTREECGITDNRTSLIVKRRPFFVLQPRESLRALLVRAKGPRQSRMFLVVLHIGSEKKSEAVIRLMTSVGWSESEFSYAFRKGADHVGFIQKRVAEKDGIFGQES